MNFISLFSFAAFRTPVSPWDTLFPALCRVRVRLMSVLLDQRPSLLTLRQRFPVFVRMVHRYYAAVRLLGDVHAGRTAFAFTRRPAAGLAAGVSEVSRFSCMKFLGVSGVFDYAGLSR